jgi:hypothetical protein
MCISCPAGSKNCRGTWSTWSACNVTCGDGFRSQTFTVTSPARNGGTCVETDNGGVQWEACNGTAVGFTNAPACDTCLTGHGGLDCQKCVVDTYSAGGLANSTNCTACDDGSITKGPGASSCGECLLVYHIVTATIHRTERKRHTHFPLWCKGRWKCAAPQQVLVEAATMLHHVPLCG